MSDEFNFETATDAKGVKAGRRQPMRQRKAEPEKTPMIEPAANQADNKEDSEVVRDPSQSQQYNPKYEKAELEEIFDSIIFSGSYEEDVLIRGKLQVTFRTRDADEVNAIGRAVDAIRANLVQTIQDYRSILNLNYALVSYNGKDLGTMKPDDRASFIGKLPGPVVGALVNALFRFDHKVAEACKEGEGNF